MKNIYIILLFPFVLFSQEEKLRFEIIDVFKDYSPVIANSIKINNQPIYNDTLQEKIISNKPILTRNILLRELINFEHPSKFQLHQSNIYFGNSASLELGSHSFFQTKLHYNNGLSVRHNSGFNLQLSAEDYSLKSPYYKKNNGDFFRQIQLYTTRFLNNKILKTDFQINSLSGLYWGRLENFNTSDIAYYKGSNITFNTSLNQNTANSFFQSADLRFNYFLNNYNRTETYLLSSVNFQTTKSLKKYSISLFGQLVQSGFDSSLELLSIPLNPNVTSYAGAGTHYGERVPLSMQQEYSTLKSLGKVTPQMMQNIERAAAPPLQDSQVARFDPTAAGGLLPNQFTPPSPQYNPQTSNNIEQHSIHRTTSSYFFTQINTR